MVRKMIRQHDALIASRTMRSTARDLVSEVADALRPEELGLQVVRVA
jgi:hypothetical protein